MSNLTLNRRSLLLGASAITAASYSRIYGANERINLGLIGCGSRGTGDMRNFLQLGVEVTALCDIYGAQLERTRQYAPKAKSFS
ncbi:MAG TPA: hypothetical protein VME43_25135, partial [Bryobacteraceae bacterium]|nr:hypothetical protein [Bryobacteraceae bacterium]